MTEELENAPRSKLGRKPEMRRKIDDALKSYEDGTLIEEDAGTLSDWDVVQHATASQACRFQRAYERRGNSTPIAAQQVWFKVLRVRVEQSGKQRMATGPDDAFARATAAEVSSAAEMLVETKAPEDEAKVGDEDTGSDDQVETAVAETAALSCSPTPGPEPTNADAAE